MNGGGRGGQGVEGGNIVKKRQKVEWWEVTGGETRDHSSTQRLVVTVHFVS